MAVLSIDTLTGCSSIPSFLGGTSDTPANPSITIFHNTSAPTNWTKNTAASINDIALRVIGGAEGVGISTGGTLPFTTVFSPKTSPITSSSVSAGSSIDPSPSGVVATQTGASGVTIQNRTLDEPMTPFHGHTFLKHPGAAAPATTSPGAAQAASAAQSAQTTGPGGGPGSHGHTLTAPHSHPITDNGHTHPFNNTGAHTHTFTLNQDFNILYVDVIIATKD